MRRVSALNWNHHEKNIYWKIIHWFKIIKKILQDSAILAENIYNINEIKIILFMSDSVKVLVDKNDKWNYRDACIKWTLITVIECISADDKYLNSMIIWSVIIH